MKQCYATRGFLPCDDPATELALGEPYAVLDTVGRMLPSLLLEKDARDYLRRVFVPDWPYVNIPADLWSQACLYYTRLGFIASGYVNQIGQPACHSLPANLARPLCKIAKMMQRPPILSYDGYALYNWRRFDLKKPIELGNIDTLQNFVHLYDEHWFILVHIEIEVKAAEILDAVLSLQDEVGPRQVDAALEQITVAMTGIIQVLQRIPERMSDELYYSKFRPYIGQFREVVYEGVNMEPISFRGETGAQSSIMPLLTEFMKIPHQNNKLTRHLYDMRQYMPAEHQLLLEQVRAMPDIKLIANSTKFDAVLEQMACFREVHYHWAIKYIARRCNDQQGTGGTPYIRWLKFLIEETRAHKKSGGKGTVVA
ncbi:MAG: indoleamine 2,3-dioxygenase [Neptuniibacter sp.]